MKIILWGYPYKSDTLSYVWHGFFKAFRALGHEITWYEDTPDGRSVATFHERFKDAVVICEEYQTKYLPILENTIYLVHTCIKPEKYLGKCKRLIDLRYNTDYQDHTTNYKYHLDRFQCEKIGPLAYFERSLDFDKLYLSWATDLLPTEINLADALTPREKISYFIGTKYQNGVNGHENATALNMWIKACQDHKIDFCHIDPWLTPVTDEENHRLIRSSYLSPDLRAQRDINIGYIPCRIFKNISYGQIGLTNSQAVHNALEHLTIYHSDPHELFNLGVKYKENFARIQHQMNYVRQNHTYINRVKSILSIL
ncbi:MAG TPA: hypothetical protein PLD02_03985 [Saprospiraceae bacterium]|nr:hypothetical protein [Saprospiraceae bacterium]